VTETLEERIRSALAVNRPVLAVLAGSNGAGKSTFYARNLRALGLPFVNADDIAKTLHPQDAESMAYEAMHVAGAVRADLVRRKVSFCMETVLSDTQGSKLRFFREAQAAGYQLLFIWIRLDSAALSQARVRQRVLRGGHAVPDEKLIARFPRTRANAIEALKLADFGLVLDNSSADDPYRVVESWHAGCCSERDGTEPPP
jgi:predicted ABC-type ATPase